MLFTSIPFVILVITTFILYYLPALARIQILILIVASFVFYAYSKPWLLSILVTSCSVNAISSFGIYKSNSLTTQRWWAFLGVAVNLGMLLFFKYSKLLYLTLGGELQNLQGGGSFLLTIQLPLGISFFTFQGISLVVDTFRWKQNDAHMSFVSDNFWLHFYNTTFFKAFFPQLIAGPIVKAHQFLPQISRKVFSAVQWDAALNMLVTGYFLKMVIADNLKDQTFWIRPPYFIGFSNFNLVVMLFGYSMQIFADFAGYSLIAMGLAKLFGYHLPQNFRFPYISRTFSEFWTRWHLSLSMWLREYLYIPLGGNRHGAMRTYLNLFAVMFLGGLWHGAGWNYALWGTFHGWALALERFFHGGKSETDPPWPMVALKMLLVFSLVTLAWLLFTLPHFADVVSYLKAMVGNAHLPTGKRMTILIALYSLPVLLYHAYHLHISRNPDSSIIRWRFIANGIMLFLIVVNSGGSGDFIYFQF